MAYLKFGLVYNLCLIYNIVFAPLNKVFHKEPKFPVKDVYLMPLSRLINVEDYRRAWFDGMKFRVYSGALVSVKDVTALKQRYKRGFILTNKGSKVRVF